jgi:hypothetical protein
MAHEMNSCVQTSLSNVADLLTGCTFRRPPGPPTGEATVRVLSLGDVSPDGRVLSDSPARFIEPQPGFERYSIQPGDILFRGRGGGFAAAVAPKMEEPTAVAAPLVIVRPHSVEPGFLAWALNRPAAHAFYAVTARGTALPAIGAKELAMIPIPLPPLQVQRRIAEIWRLADEQARLEHRLSDLRKIAIDHALQRAAEGAITDIAKEQTP